MKLLGLLTLSVISGFAGAQPIEIEPITPPPFGYNVGSILKHDYTFDLPPGWRLDSTSLPSPGPINPWLEIRELALQPAKNDHRRLKLTLKYQIFPQLKEVASLTIPALPLIFSGPQNQHHRGELPSWSFTATPLIPPRTPDNQVELRPLWHPQPLNLANDWLKLAASLFTMFLLLVSLAWTQGRLPLTRTCRPFAKALRKIKQASRLGRPDLAAKAIHYAINETAQQVVFAQNLPDFIKHHPEFAQIEPRLRHFFDTSQDYFFSGTLSNISIPLENLMELCKLCKKIEQKCPR